MDENADPKEEKDCGREVAEVRLDVVTRAKKDDDEDVAEEDVADEQVYVRLGRVGVGGGWLWLCCDGDLDTDGDETGKGVGSGLLVLIVMFKLDACNRRQMAVVSRQLRHAPCYSQINLQTVQMHAQLWTARGREGKQTA